MNLRKILTISILALAFNLMVFSQTKKPVAAKKPVPTATPVQTTGNRYSDYKISQKMGMGEKMSFEQTSWAKGVRERHESKLILDPNDKNSAMMAQMMPNNATLRQCDLKQDVTISDKKRAYFIDYYDWSGLSPEQLKRRPVNKPVVIKGTMTFSSAVTDSGKRQMMYGLQARWLKHVTTMVMSADSCEGKADLMTEEEGWYVTLSLNSESCLVPRPPPSKGGCRPKFIIGKMQNPGFFLEGTRKMYSNGKLTITSTLETTALSKATLDQALFEIPTSYKEVDSEQELMPNPGEMLNMNATTEVGERNEDGEREMKASNMKTVAIDFFSGNASKVNQDQLRTYISSKLSANGMSGFAINSQADLLTGKFVNVIGVELKKIKESSGAKIGGLFGKVTGNSDAAKLGDSEAEIVITIYGKDGKTVVVTASETAKVKGKPDDAVKAAIDKIIGGLLAKIK
jgi:hypothetical protein